jgi:hypothetical protein
MFEMLGLSTGSARQKGEKERGNRLNAEDELTDSHQDGAKDHGAVETEPAIGERPADQWHEERRSHVAPVDLSAERLGKSKPLVHLQRQERHHGMEAVPFPQRPFFAV